VDPEAAACLGQETAEIKDGVHNQSAKGAILCAELKTDCAG